MRIVFLLIFGAMGCFLCCNSFSAISFREIEERYTVGKSIHAMAMSPDESWLALATDQGIWRYDLNKKSSFPWLLSSSGVTQLVFAPRGSAIAWINGKRELFLTDLETKCHLLSSELSFEVTQGVAFSSDGHYMAFPTKDRKVLLYGLDYTREGNIKLTSLVQRLMLMSSRITSVAFSKQGKLLAVGEECGRVSIYSIPCGRLVGQVALRGNISYIQFIDHDKQFLVATLYGQLHVWQFIAPKQLDHLIDLWTEEVNVDDLPMSLIGIVKEHVSQMKCMGRFLPQVAFFGPVLYVERTKRLIALDWQGTLTCWGIDGHLLARRRGTRGMALALHYSGNQLLLADLYGDLQWFELY